VELYLHSSSTSSWRDARLKHRGSFTFSSIQDECVFVYICMYVCMYVIKLNKCNLIRVCLKYNSAIILRVLYSNCPKYLTGNCCLYFTVFGLLHGKKLETFPTQCSKMCGCISLHGSEKF